MDSIVLNRQQVRSVDRRAIDELGMNSLVLMENAGRECAEILAQLGANGPIVIACGKGNNGGDGFVLARHLDNCGIPVHVLIFAAAEELSADAAANLAILRHHDVPIDEFPLYTAEDAPRLQATLNGAEWIVDGLLGTGASGPPRPPLDRVIEILNDHPASKLALDIPSGLDCDTGKPEQPTFQAEATCTFAAMKPGLIQDQARPYVGTIYVIDIGVPKNLIQQIAQAPPA